MDEESKLDANKKRIKRVKQSQLRFVSSRSDLLQNDKSLKIEKQQPNQQNERRTKILATIGSIHNNYNMLEKMYKAGANGFLVNLTYSTIEHVKQLKQNRDLIEQNLNCRIPIICSLQGNIVRIGMLETAEIILKKGQQYRFIIEKNIIGNKYICSLTDSSIFEKIKIGDKLLVDYGQISLTVDKFQSSRESLIELENQYGKDIDFIQNQKDNNYSIRKRFQNYTTIIPNIQQINNPADDDNNISAQFIPTRRKTIDLYQQKQSIQELSQIQDSSQIEQQISQSSTTQEFQQQSIIPQYQQNQQNVQIQQQLQQQQQLNEDGRSLSNSNSTNNDLRGSLSLNTESDQTVLDYWDKDQQIQYQQNVKKTKNKFSEKLAQIKKNNQKNYKIMVCTVDIDCKLKAYKPIFQFKQKVQEKKSSKESSNEISQEEEQQEEETSPDIITPKDIIDANSLQYLGIQYIIITNVTSVENIRSVKEIMQDSKQEQQKNQIKYLAKIQTPEAVQNYDSILEEVEGVVIARSYLIMHFQIEKLMSHVKKMILRAHQLMKICLITGNILESMVNTQFPTYPEIVEISNLVKEFVDSIILSGETFFGNFPVESIEILSKVCLQQEQEEIQKYVDKPILRNEISINSSNSSHIILNTIVQVVKETAYKIQAKIIINFSLRGNSALKLSKLRLPCLIITLTENEDLTRKMNLLAGVRAIQVPSIVGQEAILKKIIKNLKNDGTLQIGDFVIITCGSTCQSLSTYNIIKLRQIE